MQQWLTSKMNGKRVELHTVNELEISDNEDSSKTILRWQCELLMQCCTEHKSDFIFSGHVLQGLLRLLSIVSSSQHVNQKQSYFPSPVLRHADSLVSDSAQVFAWAGGEIRWTAL
ncbi:unnamed protein product [Chrysodeixis includens]|uniref:Uncharacterized protein n=1 Tax=Chrysodeixis includens TaxID=689277 RepID=A0A9N8KSZ8_CHRIL|nr:unnamed protein product [Chrysodeixis includens]